MLDCSDSDSDDRPGAGLATNGINANNLDSDDYIEYGDCDGHYGYDTPASQQNDVAVNVDVDDGQLATLLEMGISVKKAHRVRCRCT